MVNQQNVPYFISGDKVVKFHDMKDIRKNPKVFDLPTVSQWYSEDPNRRHLGDLSFFGNKTTVPTTSSLSVDLMNNSQVMEVGAEGKFTYDVPFFEERSCTTVRDTSDQPFPGIDGTEFTIVLSDEFTTGDILSNDAMYGDQIIVTDQVVEQLGDGFEHVVKLVSNDKKEYFMAENLRAGISYFKLTHQIFGERGTNFSNLTMPGGTSYFTCEFQLGNEMGVETYITGKADKTVNFTAASSDTMKYMQGMEGDMDNFAQRYGNAALLYDRLPNGQIDKSSAKLSSTVEILLRREFNRLRDNKLMFQRAGTYKTSNGVARMNEGLWWQLRRGKIINYSRKGGMTRSHIKEAVEYIFRGNDLDPVYREIMFKCGSFAFENFMEIFSDEVNAQLARLSNVTNLLGTDGQIPKSPISGTLTELQLNAVRFTGVHLPGIGMVKVERDISLDYLGDMADRFSSGFNSGKTHGAYSAVIWDAKNQSYSNNKRVPKGAKIVEGGSENASIYLVKPEGDAIVTGYQKGRYDPNQSRDIISSGMKQRGFEMFAYSWGEALFLADPSSYVTIELTREARKGYV